MRSWTLFVITFALIGGLSAATWVVATHELTITPAQAAGLKPPYRGLKLGYNPRSTPETIQEMETLLAGDADKHFIWWTYLGEMHYAAGNPEKAREAWREGARLARLATEEDLDEPFQWTPWYRLAWCRMRLGEEHRDAFLRAAELIRQEMDRIDDRDAEPWVWGRLFLGFALRHLGSEYLARQTWQEGLDLFIASRPRGPASFHYNVGRFRELMGDRDGALRAFRVGAANRGFWRNFAIDWTPALEQIRRTPEFRALRDIERSPEPVWLPEFQEAAERWQEDGREYGG